MVRNIFVPALASSVNKVVNEFILSLHVTLLRIVTVNQILQALNKTKNMHNMSLIMTTPNNY